MHSHDLNCPRSVFLLPILLLALGLTACEGGHSELRNIGVPGGDVQRGAALIEEIGCGACHHIPGIDEAEGLVGPPLLFWSRRSYIAGKVPNSTENLIRWVMNPNTIEPQTAMPNLDISEQQARDIAAYLYSIE